MPHHPAQPEPSPLTERVGPPGARLQLFTPGGYEWTRVTLPVAGLPAALAGLRVVHLTDLHTTHRWHAAYDQLLAQLAAADPHLLLVTGDFVDDKWDHRAALPVVTRLVAGFRARLGVFGILGNHDRMHFAPRLDDSPVKLIVGQRRLIEHNGTAIELVGLPGEVREDLTDAWLASFPPRPDASLRIVLAHYPDQIRRTTGVLRPDIQLAGHTHGGQICLPNGWPPITHDGLPRRYAKGVHRVDDTWLVVGRGFGTTGLPIRAFCSGQVIELVLQPA